MMFSVERTVEIILEFHRFEERKRQIEQCPCPVLDGSGYALYSFTDAKKCVQVSPSTVTTFSEDPDSVFYHFPLENIRRDLPPFLRWLWGDRFRLDEEWYVPEPWAKFEGFDWETYQEEVIDRCIGTTDYYGIDCHFRSDYCPCAMVT